jgi:hypothetical protein
MVVKRYNGEAFLKGSFGNTANRMGKIEGERRKDKPGLVDCERKVFSRTMWYRLPTVMALLTPV